VSHKLETLRKIISGGQTGVGRAALDFEIEHDIPHGGWCPKDRKAEDGPLAAKYLLTETPSSNYLQRNRIKRSRFGRQRYLLDRAGTDRWLKENYRFRDQT
jgi:hypothetical protein